jgi:hypothetical protein
LLLVLTFYAVTWVSKYWSPLYDEQPWSQDPYQATVYFDFVLLPVLAAAGLARSVLYLHRPLPLRCGEDLLRLARLCVALVMGTLVAEWVAVALYARAWTASALVQVVLLGALTACGVGVAWLLRRATSQRWIDQSVDVPGPAPDWLDDAVSVSLRVGTKSKLVSPDRVRALAQQCVTPLSWVRRHPVVAAAVVSLILAMGADGTQVVLEGYSPMMAVIFVAVTAGGLFAFVLVAGAYLRVVRTGGDRPKNGPLVHAIIAAAVALPVVTAFRDPLWGLVGADPATAGTGQLGELLLLGAGLIFVSVWALEHPIRRQHRA